jgi:hypothetical protein
MSAAFRIQHAVRLRHISCVACPALKYFSHYLSNGTILKKKKLLNTKCVFLYFLKYLCEIFLILRRAEQDMIKNVHRFSYKVPVILVRFYCNLNFLDSFSKNTRISTFMEIRTVGAEFFHVDRRTKRS